MWDLIVSVLDHCLTFYLASPGTLVNDLMEPYNDQKIAYFRLFSIETSVFPYK